MRRKPDSSNKTARLLHKIGKALKTDRRVALHPDGFTLFTPAGATRASATPPPAHVTDVFSSIIRIESPLSVPQEAERVDEVLAAANMLATVAAAVRDDDGAVRAVTILPVPRDLEEEVFAEDSRLILGTVMMQSASFHHALRTMAGVEDPSGLSPEAEAPSRWVAEDFQKAADLVGGTFRVRVDGTSLVFDTPFGEDDAHNALVAIHAARHMVFGNGLRFALALPMHVPADRAATLCRVLNSSEVEEGCGAPLIGAWAIGPQETVIHTGFISNMLYDPTLIARLPYWLGIRARWASAFVEVD